MIANERRYYRIAVGCSLAIHLFIFILLLPPAFGGNAVLLQSVPVGIVELPGTTGGNSGGSEGSVSGAAPGVPEAPQAATVKQAPPPKLESVASGKSRPKPAKVPPAAPQGIPGGAGTTGSQGVPGVQGTGTGSGGSGTGDGGLGDGNGTGSIGLGNGEGKMLRLGVLPPYPKGAMNDEKEGEVGVRILILAGGGLEDVQLMRPSGDARFDNVVLKTIRNDWQFKPERRNYYIDLIFQFSLTNGVAVKFVNAATR